MAGEQGSDGPIRVMLLLGSLHGGGAERVAVQLLDRLPRLSTCPGGFAASMGLLRAAGPYLPQVDPARLTVARCGDALFDFDGTNRTLYRPGKLLRGAWAAPAAFRAMIEQARPDVVLSFLRGTNLMVWRALAGLRGPRPAWIAREGNNAPAVIAEEAPGRLARAASWALTARAYRAADRMLAISDGLARDLAADFGLDPSRVATIHNPVDTAAIADQAAEPVAGRPARPFILAAGRLEVQKGHDLLLRAFAASGCAHDLVILGQGSLRSALEDLAGALGLGGRVHFPGFVANPFAWMRACDLFVLPSRWEGFGTVLAEAQAAGAAVLASDCRHGPGEIVEHGLSGWLVPVDDEAALAQAMTHLLGDPPLRRSLSEGGRRGVERFRLAVILSRYGALIEQVAAERGRDRSGMASHRPRFFMSSPPTRE